MTSLPARFAAASIAVCLPAAAPTAVPAGAASVPPREVSVLPVFFVPAGEPRPSPEQVERLRRHLEWTRDRYRELLGGVTFAIADRGPLMHRSGRPLAFFRQAPEAGIPAAVGELLTELGESRYHCPHVLLVVVMNPADEFPPGGGRPLNGGFDAGGGVAAVSSFALDRVGHFQSTLQHELGHAFGLPHVDAYGYDMRFGDSIMSYDPGHHTDGFSPSPTPGRLIPEDLRGLSFNRRAFPGLRFDPERDVPAGYALAEPAALGPMTIPGHQGGPRVTTDSGEAFGSRVSNVVNGPRVAANEPSADPRPGAVTFDPRSMWHSDRAAAGRVSVEVEFPFEAELTAVAVHSEHSGRYHAADAVRVAVRDADGAHREIAAAGLATPDETVKFPPTRARRWRFEFRAGGSGYVVLRGLRFFSGDDELFGPLIPVRP